LKVIPVRTERIEAGCDLVDLLLNRLSEMGVELQDGDIILVADKAISHAQGRFVDLSTIKPSNEAVRLAEESSLEPEFAEVVLREADAVIGTSLRTILTVKNGNLVANAGVDHKNAPPGCAALWPEDPNREARDLAMEVRRRTGKLVGVIIVDSRLSPLRRGTTGFALGMYGFIGIRDYRGRRDLFGRRILVTTLNVADDLAAAGHVYMGEGRELTPFVIIRGAPVEMGGFDPEDLKISPKECAYFSPIARMMTDEP